MRDIWEEMQRMQEEMDHLFENFFRERRPMIEGPAQKGAGKEIVARQPFRAPVCNVYQTEKSVVATFEIPGADKDGIDLNVTETAIEVKAERKVEKEAKDEKKGYYSYMSSASRFYRHLPLPAKVDSGKSVAVYKDGVLKVTMQKMHVLPDKGCRKIQIQ
jgi:HSP20 family protein